MTHFIPSGFLRNKQLVCRLWRRWTCNNLLLVKCNKENLKENLRLWFMNGSQVLILYFIEVYRGLGLSHEQNNSFCPFCCFTRSLSGTFSTRGWKKSTRCRTRSYTNVYMMEHSLRIILIKSPMYPTFSEITCVWGVLQTLSYSKRFFFMASSCYFEF